MQGEEGDHHPHAGGQQHANRFTGLGEGLDPPAEREARADDGGVGQRAAVLVLQDLGLAAEPLAGVDQGVEQGERARGRVEGAGR